MPPHTERHMNLGLLVTTLVVLVLGWCIHMLWLLWRVML